MQVYQLVFAPFNRIGKWIGWKWQVMYFEAFAFVQISTYPTDHHSSLLAIIEDIETFPFKKVDKSARSNKGERSSSGIDLILPSLPKVAWHFGARMSVLFKVTSIITWWLSKTSELNSDNFLTLKYWILNAFATDSKSGIQSPDFLSTPMNLWLK